jgi:hypothetical protein
MSPELEPEPKGSHNMMDLSSDADASVWGFEGDHAMAFTPATWPRSILRSLKGAPSFVTAYMCMVASADDVARTVPSGENLTQVIPRA